jgi:hypothetical protein
VVFFYYKGAGWLAGYYSGIDPPKTIWFLAAALVHILQYKRVVHTPSQIRACSSSSSFINNQRQEEEEL